jgi:hypothetical protein
VLFVLAAWTWTAEAQRPVGALRDVRGLKGCVPTNTSRRAPGDAVRVSRSPSGFVELQPVASVNLTDQIRVKRLVDAKVLSDGSEGFGRGTIVFAPDLGTCTGYAGEFQRRGRQLGGTQPGSYTITSRAERVANRDTTRLVIGLEYGGVVVDWQGGLMSIVALGREIQLRGTRVAVVVDSAGTEAFVMVRVGSVFLTGIGGAAGRTINAGRVARFSRASAQVVETAINEDLVSNERYHAESVFEAPMQAAGFSFAKAFTTAIVIGGVGYGGYYAYDKWIRKDKTSNGFINGRIIVRIPL